MVQPPLCRLGCSTTPNKTPTRKFAKDLLLVGTKTKSGLQEIENINSVYYFF
jgi:hypothetical protein